MQNRYNFAQDLRISIRGFGARAAFGIRGVKILVDGIPETLPDGTGQVDSIDLGATSQIEVIRGPSSSLYGNASGGVISITSEDGPEIPYIDARLAVGDYDFQKLQVKAGGQTERMNYFVSVSDSEIDGYRAFSQYENTQLSGRFDFDLGGDANFLAVVNFTDQPLANDPGGINAAQAAADPRSARDRNVAYDTGEALEQTRIGFVYTTPIFESGELSARSYFVWRDFQNKLPQFPVADAVDLERFFAGGGINYTHSSMLGNMPNRLIVGFDADDQDDDRRRFRNNQGTLGALRFDQNESFNAVGVFLQDELSITDQLQVTFGIRYDEIEYAVEDYFLADGDDSGTREMDNVSPMLGILYSLSPDISLYGTLSTAFETPSTTDFANPSGGGGFNPDLDPQSATNYEVGLRGTIGERHYYEIALYNVEVDDELIPFDIDGRNFFQNAGSSSRTGVELALVSNPTDRIRTSLTYTYGSFEFDDFRVFSFDLNGTPTLEDDFSGNTIPGTVEHLLFGEISYTHPSGWYGAFDVLYVGEQFANNANSVKVDSYTVANLRLGLERAVGSTIISPFIGINNLFDEGYNNNIRLNAFGSRYFEPAPELNVYAGVSINFDLQ
jgi:iron complex outermembrane receptor protein